MINELTFALDQISLLISSIRSVFIAEVLSDLCPDHFTMAGRKLELFESIQRRLSCVSVFVSQESEIKLGFCVVNR